MKKSITAVFVSIILSMCFAGCFDTKKEIGTSEIIVDKTTTQTMIKASENYYGIEVVSNSVINEEDVNFSSGTIGVVKTTQGKTIISIASVKGQILKGDALFTVPNSTELINLEIVSINTQSPAFQKKATALTGDFNADNKVDMIDFGIFKSAYKEPASSTKYNVKCDIAPINALDGKVDLVDFCIFANNYGKSIVVDPVVTSVAITLTPAKQIAVGDTFKFTGKATYNTGTTSTVVDWASSNTSVATIDASGNIVAKTAGTTSITAKKDSISSTSYALTVSAKPTTMTLYAQSSTAAKIYAWTGSGTTVVKLTGEWPGTAMKDEGNGYYSYTFPEIKAINVIFVGSDFTYSKGSGQTPDLTRDKEGWYYKKDGTWTWSDTDPVGPQPPKLSASPAGGYFKTTQTVTLNVSYDAKTTAVTQKYTIDGSSPKTNGIAFENGFKTTFGSDMNDKDTKTIKVYAKATSLDGVTVLENETSYVFTKGVAPKASFSWRNATVYFALTDRFMNGDKTNDHSYGRECDASGNPIAGYENKVGTFHGGDLKGMLAKIEEGYFDNLGVNAIWITAPYEQIHGALAGNGFKHYAYHGYYTLDYSTIDKNMGTEADFKALVDAAHARGIRIIMDIVLNHAGYANPRDAVEFGYGGVSPTWKDIYYGWDASKYKWFNDYAEIAATSGSQGMMTYDADWSTNWWGPNWTRMIKDRFKGYDGVEASGIDTCLDGLPDFKTEGTTDPGIPGILKVKWTKEGVYDAKVKELNDYFTKSGRPKRVTTYIGKWLTDWVRKYGVDGFRCDTAKHVEQKEWKVLKEMGVEALKEWRANNPTAVGANWTDDFWMTGEHWQWGLNMNDGYFSNGFDSMINFGFQGASAASGSALDSTFSSYATTINGSKNNALSYVSSHDCGLGRGNMENRGTALLLLPGAVQIFYGDETNRPAGGGPQYEPARSSMNWDNIDTALLTHWQKLGKFRNNHIAIGAGSHKKLNDSPYTFSRIYNTDKVICVIGASGSTSVDVSELFADGTTVRDAYSAATATVEGGMATFTADPKGIILIEEVN